MKLQLTYRASLKIFFVVTLLCVSLCPAAAPAEQQFDRYGGYMGINSKKHRSWTGTSTVLEANKLVDKNADLPAAGLVGKYLHPNAEKEFIKSADGKLKVLRFRIVKNTKTEIFTDPAGGDMTAHAKAGDAYKTTGFFTVEKLGRRWWFITPEGHGMISLSVSVIARAPRDGVDKTGKGYPHYAPMKYRKAGDTGAEWIDRWGKATLGRLRSWGFNTIGTFSWEVQRHKMMSYYGTLRLSNYSILKTGPCGKVWDGIRGGGPFPDIYNPDFLPFIDKWMQRSAKYRDDPWVIGLFPDQMDELRGFCANHPHLGLAGLIGNKKISRANGKKVKNYYKAEFIKLMKQRYEEKIERLNKAWGTEYASFEAIWDQGADAKFGDIKNPGVKDRPKFRQDLDAFEEKVAADYTKFIKAAVRKYDPNHILFSPNMGSAKATIIRGFIKAGGYDVYMARWGAKEYQLVKRPILGSTSGFLTADSDSPLRFEGDIEKCELMQHKRFKELIKCWDEDADIWWKHRGNPLKIRFPGVPVPRTSIKDPWNFQVVATGKDEDGKSWFAARSGGGYRSGHPKELAEQINKMLEAGKKPRYARFSFGGCTDQKDRARKWTAALQSIVTDKSADGDYFRLGMNWWKLSDNGWTYWVERYNFGLVTLKDNAYDGKEATKLGADGKAGTWDDEENDYGDLLTGVTRANTGIYGFILEQDAKDKGPEDKPGG